MTRKLRRVPKDKKTGVPKKYLSGSKNRSAKAAEIKRTAEAYRKGEYIDIKAVGTRCLSFCWIKKCSYGCMGYGQSKQLHER